MSSEKAPWENFHSIVTQYKLNQKSSRQFIKPKKYFFQYLQGTMPEYKNFIEKQNTVFIWIDNLLRGIGLYFNISNPFLGLMGLIAIGMSNWWQLVSVLFSILSVNFFCYFFNYLDKVKESGLYSYNPVFIGLTYSYLNNYAEYSSLKLIPIICISSILSHLIFISLGQILVNKLNISLQIYPALFITFAWMLCIQRLNHYSNSLTPSIEEPISYSLQTYDHNILLDSIVKGIVNIYFSDNYYSVIPVLIGMFVVSPMLFCYTILGSTLGTIWGMMFGIELQNLNSYSFNCISPCVFIGTMFFVPNRYTLFLSLIATFGSALFTASVETLLTPFGIFGFSLSSMMINSMFQLAPWPSGKIITITLNNITTPEDHLRRYKLKLHYLSKYPKIQSIIDNSAYSNDLNRLETVLLPVMLCQYVKENKYDEIESLLNLGADPNVVDYDKRTPLHIACKEGNIEIINLLLKYNSNIDNLDRFYHNCIYEAIRQNKYEVLKCFENPILIAPSSEIVCLLCNLVKNNELTKLELLLRMKVDPNLFDYDKRTPLHIATDYNKKEAIDLLKKYGAKDNIKDKFGNKVTNDDDDTVVNIDDMIDNLDKNDNDYNEDNHELYKLITNIILENPQEYHEFIPYICCNLASMGDLVSLRMLHRKRINLLQPDYDNRTAIHLACCQNKKEIVKYLSLNYENLNILDDWGHTPLYDACINKNSEIVDLLLDNNCSLDLSDNESVQTVGWSSSQKNYQLISLLIKCKINLDAKDYDNRSCQELIQECNYYENKL